MNPSYLPNQWREKAEEQRRLAGEAQAATFEYCADELERAWRLLETEPLSLQEAADFSGFSYSAIQKMVANEELLNVGEKGSPRVQRGDLPKKATRRKPWCEKAGPDLADLVLQGREGSLP